MNKEVDGAVSSTGEESGAEDRGIDGTETIDASRDLALSDHPAESLHTQSGASRGEAAVATQRSEARVQGSEDRAASGEMTAGADGEPTQSDVEAPSKEAEHKRLWDKLDAEASSESKGEGEGGSLC